MMSMKKKTIQENSLKCEIWIFLTMLLLCITVSNLTCPRNHWRQLSHTHTLHSYTYTHHTSHHTTALPCTVTSKHCTTKMNTVSEETQAVFLVIYILRYIFRFLNTFSCVLTNIFFTEIFWCFIHLVFLTLTSSLSSSRVSFVFTC